MFERYIVTLTGAMAAGLIGSTAGAEGLYFGGYGGLASVDDFDIGNTLSFDNGFAFGAVLGTTVNENLRVEGELSYLGTEGECDGKCAAVDFDLTALSLLGNAWVDFETGSNVSPYLGGGLGIAQVSLDSALADGEDTGIAYQLGFGARFGASGEFDIGYRYRSVSVDIDEYSGEELDANSHLLLFGWTGRF